MGIVIVVCFHQIDYFIKCRDLGIGDDDYPFNTESKGERSLRQYLDRLPKEDSHIASQRISEDAKNMLSSIGTKTKYTRNAVIPYSCVQVDGHIIDIIYTSKVPLDDGTFASMECQRCWLFAVIDVATRCIIGYSLSQEYNYNQFDVLSGIKNSILKHTEIKENTLQLPMPENGGFPSTAFAELKNAMPDCIMLDNAKAHLSSNVIEKITNNLKCSMDFGPVSAPETRAIVERFFGTLERKGFHRLPATTGSNMNDAKRKDPEKNARKYEISFDDIQELIEALIAEYNNTPHSSLLNISPLEEMHRKMENGMFPYIATDIDIECIKRLTNITKSVNVKGDMKNGRRPYVQFCGARYRNDLLAANYKLLGQKITIDIDPEDISTVVGYLDDGTCIGKLTAAGEYGMHSHSLKSRKLMEQMANRNKIKHYDIQTPVSDFENVIRKRAASSKRARTRMDILNRELKSEISAKAEGGMPDIISTSEYVDDTELSRDDIMTLPSEALWRCISGGAADA